MSIQFIKLITQFIVRINKISLVIFKKLISKVSLSILLLQTLGIFTYAAQGRRDISVEFSLIKNGTITSAHKNIPSSGLKIVWWNIGCGLETGIKKIKENPQTTALEENLILLANSPIKPDVLILGEYCPYSMSTQDQNQLIGSFKNYYHLERNIPYRKTSEGKVNQRNGFLILSDLDISVLEQETLFATKDSSKSNDNRMYLLFKVQKDGKDFLINPVHLVNPWRELFNEQGIFGVFAELTSGAENKNAVQIANLLEKYNTHSQAGVPYIIVGDFNSPGRIMGVSGFGYNLLSKSMIPLMHNNDITFVGEGAFPASNIDHAFGVNTDSTYAKVWPFAGSLHLPIYLVIK